MKQFSQAILYTICMLLSSFPLAAKQKAPLVDQDIYRGAVTARAGYFLPTDSRFKDFYPGLMFYGLEWDQQIWRPIYFWLGGDYGARKGHTQGKHEVTKVEVVRIDLGPKLVYKAVFRPTLALMTYAGIGPQITYLHSKTNSTDLIQSQSNWGIGAMFNTGVMLKASGFMIDLFANYSIQTINMHDTPSKPVIVKNAHISGFTLGGAVGYCY